MTGLIRGMAPRQIGPTARSVAARVRCRLSNHDGLRDAEFVDNSTLRQHLQRRRLTIAC